MYPVWASHRSPSSNQLPSSMHSSNCLSNLTTGLTWLARVGISGVVARPPDAHTRDRSSCNTTFLFFPYWDTGVAPSPVDEL